MSKSLDKLMETYYDYATAMNLALDLLPWDEIDRMLQILRESPRQHRKIFVMGSGTSAGPAERLAAEMAQASLNSEDRDARMQVIPLINRAPKIPIWGDESHGSSFVAALRLCLHAKDVVIAIAAERASSEIVNAVVYSKQRGAYTIGLVSIQSANLASVFDLTVTIPTDSPALFEDVQQVMAHILVITLRKLRKVPNRDPIRI